MSVAVVPRDGGEVARTDDAAAAAAAAAPLCSAVSLVPFPDFFAHTCRAGLTVIHEYDANTLLAYAEQALMLEQKLVTGCYLLQAVLLVEYSVRTGGASHERAQDFGSIRHASIAQLLAWWRDWLTDVRGALCFVACLQCVRFTSSDAAHRDQMALSLLISRMRSSGVRASPCRYIR